MEGQQRQLLWKQRADLAFAAKNWKKAADAFNTCLGVTVRGKSMGVKRDCYEGLARCHLKLGNLADAQSWAEKLHSTSNLINVDHVSTSHSVLAEVSRALGRHVEEISNLSLVINVHPFAPSLWFKMASAYGSLSDEDAEALPISGGKNKLRCRCEAFCLVRAFVLLKTVERTVKSFAKAANEKRKEEVQSKLKELRVSPEEVDRMELFASMDVFNKKGDGGEEESQGEFEDLGKSVRQKAIEESYREGEKEEGKEANHLERASQFEKQWLNFLIE